MGKLDREKKKIERDKKRDEEFQKTKNEIEELIKNINEMTGNEEAIRMVDLKLPSKKERILSFFLKYSLSFILILGITGFLNWVYYDSIFIILAFALSIVTLECVLDFIIKLFFGKFILYSLGTINILPPILSFVICSLVFPFIELVNVWLLIAVILSYLIIRKIMLSLLKSDNNKKLMIRGK